MKIYGSEGVLLMEVAEIAKGEQGIYIKGKMMGQVPMTAVLKPEDLREALKLLSAQVVFQALKMLLLPGKRKN